MANPRRGLRCDVCTGCGLCPGVTTHDDAKNKILILTEYSGQTEKQFCAKANAYLVTVDIGTTTVAMLLLDASGHTIDRYVTVNPQVEYGADVISRIQAAGMGAAEDLRRKITEALAAGLETFKKKLPADATLQGVIAANTTETYLLMGWNTEELGQAPFHASHLEPLTIHINNTPFFVFPGLSAFVGGDIAAGIYALDLTEKAERTLLIDLGTNGEIVLGNREQCIACATAAGPAFEGGANRGVWGADMISLLATLRRKGMLDETGLLADPFFERGVRIGNITVTNEAVRSVQMAKAAIAAGIEVLMQKSGLEAEQVDRVVLAGGFGYFLNPEDAAELGLLPEKLAAKAYAGGNTVLAGTKRAGYELLQEKQNLLQEQLSKIAQKVTIVNLAKEEGFADCYMSHFPLRYT